MTGYATLGATYIGRGLTNVTYRHTASYTDSMWLLMSAADKQTSQTDTSRAGFHLTISHSGRKQNEGVALLATIVA